ncbi:hypothetical protein L218DRAFT_998797 [Marasmius fiardii PR-910]|nr:hypothetical protein L218DRAFT_998797 [Marasmius fiardii PR-910]
MNMHDLTFSVWIPLQLTALVGLVLIQLTTLFGGLTRGRVWYAFTLSWSILAFSSCLLFISGQQPTSINGKVPNLIVCSVQTALMYSGYTLVVAMLLSLSLELYWKILSIYSQDKIVFETQLASSAWLIIAPYGSWCLMTTIFLVIHINLDSRFPWGGYRMIIVFAVQPLVRRAYYILLASGPLTVAVVFGSQTDILSVWAALPCAGLAKLQSMVDRLRITRELKNQQ